MRLSTAIVLAQGNHCIRHDAIARAFPPASTMSAMMATGKMKSWLRQSVSSDLDAAIGWVREKSRPSPGSQLSESLRADSSLPHELSFVDNGSVFQIVYKRATCRLALLYVSLAQGGLLLHR